MHNPLSTLVVLLFLSLSTSAGITQKDFTGIGYIHVLRSSDWNTATPAAKVGCLNEHGKFILDSSSSSPTTCGIFSRLPDFPYTLSTKAGNCTFDDTTQEKNTDSRYGKMDYAWSCTQGHKSDIYDELYTIDGFPYVFLCFGDMTCYYDAKHVPAATDAPLSLWQFRWGSEQQGITPGHVELQLLWVKIGDLPKREGEQVESPGPRVRIQEGVQVPLEGGRARG